MAGRATTPWVRGETVLERDDASPAELGARDEIGEDRIGPYLLFDDGEPSLPALDDVPDDAVEVPRRARSLDLEKLLEILRSGTCEGAAELEGAALWWLAVRPSLFPITALAVATGALAAAGTGPVGAAEVVLSALALLGAIAAHAGYNLVRDVVAARGDETVRRAGIAASLAPLAGTRAAARPSAWPVAGGRLARGHVLAGAAVACLLALVVLAALASVSGPGVAWIAAAGAVLALATLVPALGRSGLADLAAALAWGPVAVVGAALAVRGEATAAVWLGSVPWAALAGTALIGRRLDASAGEAVAAMRAGDAGASSGSGNERLRDAAVKLAQLFFLVVGGLVVAGAIGAWALLVLLALPRFRRLAVAYAPQATAAAAPPGAAKPAYGAVATSLVRTAGALLVVGLAASLVAAR
jgi:1,4-dihydroxy-2-naphthoate octaprenyltransferase